MAGLAGAVAQRLRARSISSAPWAAQQCTHSVPLTTPAAIRAALGLCSLARAAARFTPRFTRAPLEPCAHLGALGRWAHVAACTLPAASGARPVPCDPALAHWLPSRCQIRECELGCQIREPELRRRVLWRHPSAGAPAVNVGGTPHERCLERLSPLCPGRVRRRT